MYTRMEESFQQYVHGTDYRYRYTTNFGGDPVAHTTPLPYHTPFLKWVLKKIYRRIRPLVLPAE